MHLETVAQFRAAFYRLVGSDATDGALVENGEGATDVVDTALTEGAWLAQHYLIDAGLGDLWLVRSPALVWQGSDAADGGRRAALPADFLRLDGDERRSALEEADGEPWGQLVVGKDRPLDGDGYYLRGGSIWLLRGAAPPATLYARYYARHPAFGDALVSDDITIPPEVRKLVVAYAGEIAMEESWLPGGPEMEQKILRNVAFWEAKAMKVARRTREPRRFRRPVRYGNHW